MSTQNSRRPADTPFKQQRLKAWQPILTPSWVIGTFALLGVLFIPIGYVLLEQSNGVKEIVVQYDGEGGTVPSCVINSANANKMCQVSMTAIDDMEGPVYVYYELSNYYQNHRRYVKSLSFKQLQGKLNTPGNSYTSDCSPLENVKSDGQTLLLSPCGLIANSLFNDIFKLTSSTNSEIEMSEDGIAWKSDIEDKFQQPDGFEYNKCDSQEACCDKTTDGEKWCGAANEPYVDEDGEYWEYFYPQDSTTQYLYESYPEVVAPIDGVKNEHFIVWMRTAGLPRFRKLYGVIDKNLNKGDVLTFNVTANFDVRRFKGTKSLVISTTSWFGGKNNFLGYSYIVVGVLCMLLSALFGAKHMINPRKLGDTRYLVWKEA